MGWSRWKELATKEEWYPDNIRYSGPACYELGIKGKWKRYVIQTYVGSTGNLQQRMTQYARNGSHLHRIVSKYWKYDYTLWYRYYPFPSKQKAEEMEGDLLNKYGLEKYPWNTYFGNNR
ncbi:MAG: GIY-YIG nuclease family protein [Thermoplasmata archaeon]